MEQAIIIDGVKYITPELYAEKNGVSLRTVYYWMKRGKLNTYTFFKKKLVAQN